MSDGTDGSDGTGVEDHLDDLRPHPVVQRFVLELAADEPLWSDRRGGYVSLRPPVDDSEVAVFVYKDRVEVCLAPERARAYGDSITGSRVFSPTATTTHWVIPAALCVSDDAMRAAREAVTWRRDAARYRPAVTSAPRATRTRTPRAPRTPKAPAVAPPVVLEAQCPIHFIPSRICECNE